MQLTNPYPYKELKRTSVDGQRLYENPWGDPVPSVTTILSATQPAEKRAALANWRKRVGTEEAQRVTTTAANRGTVMHNILEHWALGQYDTYNPGNNIVHQQAKAMAAEVIMYKGKQTIMDFKQTNKPKKKEWIDDYFMQGAAYALAHNEMYETKIENIAIFMCSGDLQFQLFESEASEFKDWEVKWSNRVAQFYNVS